MQAPSGMLLGVMGPTSSSDELVALGPDEDTAWDFLLALRTELQAQGPMRQARYCRLEDGPQEQPKGASNLRLVPDSESGWEATGEQVLADGARQLLDLFLPLLTGAGSDTMVLAHLGQSLDGRIATIGGVSKFITGPENLLHTHRLRALFDAVVVGTHTALEDDPQLTTRRARGPNPTRVLLDPRGRISSAARALQDGIAPTLLLRAEEGVATVGEAEVVQVDASEGHFDPSAVLAALRARGLRRIFIEGGGVTVSKFLQAGELDRLHLCVAPMILGSGRPSLQLDAIEKLDEGVFVNARSFRTGADLLFDCKLPAGD